MSGTASTNPITVSEPDPSVYAFNVGAFMDVVEAADPFNGVVFNAPNPGVTEAVTFSSNGQGAIAFGPGSQPQDGLNLTPAQVASYLDSVTLALGSGSGSTVTATITDSAGATTALTSTIVGGTTPNGSTIVNLEPTSYNETSANPSQTISGIATVFDPVGANGTVQVGTYALANTTVTLTDNGAPLGTTITDANGNYSTTETLPHLGGNVIVGMVSSMGATAYTAPATDTLLASPITVSEAQTTSTSVPVGGNSEGDNPFNGVSFNDPNPGVTESFTVSVSGPAPAVISLFNPSGQPGTETGLTPAQVASDLDRVLLTFNTFQGLGTDTVTATITDSAGQTTTLTSTVNAVEQNPTSVQVAISSAAETSVNPAQLISGGADLVTSVNGQQVQSSPAAGAMVTLTDNGALVGISRTDGSGNFSLPITLASVGANSLVATVAATDGTTGSSAPVVDTLLPPATAVLGLGADTLALFLSQRAEPAGAQFTVDVDGQQVGGVQTVTADTLAGQSQEVDVRGDFPAGANTVSINYLNASNSLLLLNSASLNGIAVPGGSTVLSNNGSEGFSFVQPANPNATQLGYGPDTLALFVSERAQAAGAQFTIDVNGAPATGVLTTQADVLAGQAQEFDLQGNFPTGTDAVTINYLNASNSLLFVDGATLDGTPVPGSNPVLSNIGSESFPITGPNPTVPTTVTQIGNGPGDTLALDLSQRAEPAGAQFTVAIDGAQVGGVQTVTADSTAGQFQELDVLGNFPAGTSHSVSINYLNASNSLLLVDNATIDGSTIAGGSEVLSNNGSLGFSFAAPVTTLGSGPDTFALQVSQGDFASGTAQFSIDVDGNQIGGVQTATAFNGQFQTFDVLGNFAGQHVVSVNLLNGNPGGAANPGTGGVPYLEVGGATIDGAPVSNGTASPYLDTNGVQPVTFTFTH